jgi:hypothetical protein
MFAGYHSGRSAAGKGFIASLVETTLWLLKLYGQKNGICCNDFTFEDLF